VFAVAVTAKRMLLQLLSAAAPAEASASVLVQAAALFHLSETNVRVTLARLVAAGTLELTGRGMYRLGEEAQALTRQVTSWRELEKLVRKWDGAWACVHLGGLGRTDRAALRRRERALRLLGFRTLGPGLEVRPDNVEGGVTALRERLVELGLEEPAIVLRASELDAWTDARARGLWDGKKLTTGYRQTRERIDRWLVAAQDLAPEVAAREAFVFGGEVLRQILFDPRLPEPLVDVAERRAMVEAAKRLDTSGRRLWHRLFGMAHGLVVTTEDRHEHVN
jgi:phenylacetic acid degradation operon negative regulatory protein